MDQDVWNRDDGHLAQGVKMIAAGLVSAILTATVVVAVGQTMIERQEAPAVERPASDAVLIRTSH